MALIYRERGLEDLNIHKAAPSWMHVEGHALQIKCLRRCFAGVSTAALGRQRRTIGQIGLRPVSLRVPRAAWENRSMVAQLFSLLS